MCYKEGDTGHRYHRVVQVMQLVFGNCRLQIGKYAQSATRGIFGFTRVWHRIVIVSLEVTIFDIQLLLGLG